MTLKKANHHLATTCNQISIGKYIFPRQSIALQNIIKKTRCHNGRVETHFITWNFIGWCIEKTSCGSGKLSVLCKSFQVLMVDYWSNSQRAESPIPKETFTPFRFGHAVAMGVTLKQLSAFETKPTTYTWSLPKDFEWLITTSTVSAKNSKIHPPEN